jgi:hypothetical protein
MKPLGDIAGFQRTGEQKRLGDIKRSNSIKEAIVAVPYILEYTSEPGSAPGSEALSRVKQFIEIPEERFKAAYEDTVGSKTADSLAAAGASIRKMVQKMQRYIMPPPFDFINNRDLKPVVMYIFEFEYQFDRDDLSYMWQNLAPRNSDKMFFAHSSIAHNLSTKELLTEKVLLGRENAQVRWMVFKVKQRATTPYYKLIPSQVGEAIPEIPDPTATTPEGYKVQYNWPYDYLSFVELVKMDVEVMYTGDYDDDETELGDDLKSAREEMAAAKEASVKAGKAKADASTGMAPVAATDTTTTSE